MDLEKKIEYDKLLQGLGINFPHQWDVQVISPGIAENKTAERRGKKYLRMLQQKGGERLSPCCNTELSNNMPHL